MHCSMAGCSTGDGDDEIVVYGGYSLCGYHYITAIEIRASTEIIPIHLQTERWFDVLEECDGASESTNEMEDYIKRRAEADLPAIPPRIFSFFELHE